MADVDKVIKALEFCTDQRIVDTCYGECPYAVADDEYKCLQMKLDALALLKEQELPTELKQKMWNALYSEEDEYEKKFIGTEEHHNWFSVYRPWLQKGFDIAINVIADWEGH